MSQRDFGDYLQDILTAIEQIISFSAGYNFESFTGDQKTINAITRSLEILGEAAKNIPADFRQKYPQIPWKKMAGMRDKLIHEYFGTDLEMVWKVSQEDLPALKTTIQNILNDFEASNPLPEP